MMRRQLLPAVMAVVLFTALTVIYVVGTTIFDGAVFHDKAEGSYVKNARGRVVGSRLIGQSFTKAKYFHPRPAADDYASGPGYSFGSNYGPTDPRLFAACLPVQKTDKSGAPVVDSKGNPVYETNPDGSKVCDPNTVPQRVKAYREENHLGKDALVPVDAVTASASGLDPDITVANAKLQAPRVAAARHLPLRRVLSLVEANTDDRALGILGEPAVNVLTLNLALDKLS
jgi:K+-transporting ATPase ATPase C chain